MSGSILLIHEQGDSQLRNEPEQKRGCKEAGYSPVKLLRKERGRELISPCDREISARQLDGWMGAPPIGMGTRASCARCGEEERSSWG
jgi:hypothetical protein